MPTMKSMFFQDSNSPLMEEMVFFHDHSMVVVIFITVFMLYLINCIYTMPYYNKFMLEEELTEGAWTMMPSMILVFIAIPSMKILYFTENLNNPSMSLKITGHQWYWSYSILQEEEENLYMTNSKVSRLLITDPTLKILTNCSMRLLISSSDVIHSWALPSAGVKVDGAPGRLNQSFMTIKRPGLMFGQCSEICGANHSFMPISIEAANNV